MATVTDLGFDLLSGSTPGTSGDRLRDLGQRSRRLEEGYAPFILTCDTWAARGRYIIFWANPRSMQWSFKLRAASTEVKGGTIAYYWRDSTRGQTFYNEPRVTFTFQTGNMMPVKLGPYGPVRVPPGLLDLYEFLEFMNEPAVLDNGQRNYHTIMCNSLFAPEIMLKGWFVPEQEFSFQEVAEDPAQTTWDHTFVVRSSFPDYANPAALQHAFRTFSPESPGIQAERAARGVPYPDVARLGEDFDATLGGRAAGIADVTDPSSRLYSRDNLGTGFTDEAGNPLEEPTEYPTFPVGQEKLAQAVRSMKDDDAKRKRLEKYGLSDAEIELVVTRSNTP